MHTGDVVKIDGHKGDVGPVFDDRCFGVNWRGEGPVRSVYPSDYPGLVVLEESRLCRYPDRTKPGRFFFGKLPV